MWSVLSCWWMLLNQFRSFVQSVLLIENCGLMNLFWLWNWAINLITPFFQFQIFFCLELIQYHVCGDVFFLLAFLLSFALCQPFSCTHQVNAYNIFVCVFYHWFVDTKADNYSKYNAIFFSIIRESRWKSNKVKGVCI